MSYYPLPVLNKFERKKIKKPAEKLLAFISQHATTPCRSSNNIQKRFKCQIRVNKFQTVSSIRDLAKATGYTKKTVEYHIKLLRELDLIIAQPVNWKNRTLGTLFTLNFVKKKSAKKNLGDIVKPVQIYDKNYGKNKAKFDKNLGFLVQKQYNRRKGKTMDIKNTETFKNTQNNQFRGHHTNTTNVDINKNNTIVLQKGDSKNKYKYLQLSEDTIESELKLFFTEYSKLNKDKVNLTEILHKLNEKTFEYNSVIWLCHFKGYLMNQLEKDSRPKFLRNYFYLTNEISQESVDRGYKHFMRKYDVQVITDEQRAYQEQQEKEELQKEELNAKTKKYWLELCANDEEEAARIANEAKILYGKASIARGSLACFKKLMNDDGIKKFQMASIAIALEADNNHFEKIKEIVL